MTPLLVAVILAGLVFVGLVAYYFVSQKKASLGKKEEKKEEPPAPQQ